jgi:hypothetical protein
MISNTEPDSTLKVEDEKNPSHNMTGKYAVLMEVNDKHMESWFYFIKYEGNEKNLSYLQSQLETVDWYIIDDISTFDLDLTHLVSASTAKEMTKLELNSYQWHRKFDGTLDKVNLNFKRNDKNKIKIRKAFDHLGLGQIEDYISDEDIDNEDLRSDNDSSSSSEEELYASSDSSGEESKKASKDCKLMKEDTILPPAMMINPLPKYIKAKKKKKGRGGKVINYNIYPD